MNYLGSVFIYPQFLHYLYRLDLHPYCGTGEYFIYLLPLITLCAFWFTQAGRQEEGQQGLANKHCLHGQHLFARLRHRLRARDQRRRLLPGPLCHQQIRAGTRRKLEGDVINAVADT